ncbi:MAG: DNA topoisomerase IV subunit A [Spirochaetia bacterium]|jgi:topoisomerase-4 subunit A|nr:DNA topoisomerase IV subunit A [Spirochaetia bacterium]
MAYVKKLFNDNFLYYASYVIKDRAIPDLEDGLKPVQRRILHSLFEMDDGKFHKVANIIGNTMKYHPHGDQSIGSALVVLANKELFVDKQGNFGNIFTGDEASAARYIECKASSFAKDVFYNPKITDYADSYDGRNKEPLLFPAKLPVILLTGTEGIAVGMSTKILPHNPVEVIRAEIACLQGKKFEVFPDFLTGGSVDLSEYRDGNGKVLVRASLDTSDPKKIVIREIPFSTTTESLIASVENAARSGQLKIASISDYTTDKVEIEIRLQRGVYTQEVIDALYAFTECEQSISVNCLVIKDRKPVVTSGAEIVRHHSAALVNILRRELEIEKGELLDEIHARTLERIFIEERVYKKIETQKTPEAIFRAVREGLLPYDKEIGRPVTQEDIERLLKIPIRRISLYDIEKAKDELKRIAGRLAEVEFHLAHLVNYAIDFLKSMAKRLESAWPRRTKITSFSRIEAKEAARKDIALRYDEQSGYLGTAVSSGEKLMEVSSFDRILIVRRDGMYSVQPVPDKLFVDKGLQWATIAEKEIVQAKLLTIVYRAAKTGYPHIKRCRIESWILNRDYSLVPQGGELLIFSTEPDFEFNLKYLVKGRMRKVEESFRSKNFPEKGLKAGGVRLAPREVLSAQLLGAVRSIVNEAPASKAEPELLVVRPAPKRTRPQNSKPQTPKLQPSVPEAAPQEWPESAERDLFAQFSLESPANPRAETETEAKDGAGAMPGSRSKPEPRKKAAGKARNQEPDERVQPSLGKGLFARLSEKKNAQKPGEED